MNVLIVGGGGREHALAVALAKSPKLTKLYAIPGNAGTAELGTNLPGSAEDIDAVLAAAKQHNIDFTIVGPEAPLCDGIVDRFETEGLKIFGPNKAAARIEGDKAWSKELMRRALVPTADARIFQDYEAAREYVATRDSALVVKASGLAAGKGVIVCDEPAQALLALERIMVEGEFGEAGKTVIVEERLNGPELSVLALVDDRTIYVLETARDYKRAGDGDSGPNTGGMGACSPAPGVSSELLCKIESDVFVPIVDAMRGDGAPYRGVLYAGIMLTPSGPKVLEFNCRFGDPETQVILPRVSSDLLELLLACTEGRLEESLLEWDPRAAVCIVMASGGYPGAYQKGKAISGLQLANEHDDVTVYHAGTTLVGESVMTSGGRVLGVTALGDDVEIARQKAYDAAKCITFDGAHCRSDIAAPVCA